MRMIDADALERDDWKLHRTIRVDKNTMEYQVKKPTDFPVIEPERKKGRWIEIMTKDLIGFNVKAYKCSSCGGVVYVPTRFCSNCGVDMRGEE